VPKSFDGFDRPDVRFPDGRGRDEMLPPSFAGACEDLVFFGPTGRGKTHAATALGMMAVCVPSSKPEPSPSKKREPLRHVS